MVLTARSQPSHPDRRSRSSRAALWGAVWLLVVALDAVALGVGSLKTQSALNQPFYGEIELLDVESSDLDNVKVDLADPSAFHEAGIELQPVLTGVSFTPATGPRGEPIIQVATRDPIREPFLDLLVEVIWPGGRILKEYAVLLDPPAAGVGQRAPVAPPRRSQPRIRERTSPFAEAARQGSGPDVGTPSAPTGRGSTPEVAPEPAPAVTPQPVISTVETVELPVEITETAFPLRYGPVPRGAILTRIARQMAPPGATLEQTAMALYRNNQQAFAGGDINRLLIGSSLTIPTAAELFALDPGQAEIAFGDALAGRPVASAPLTDVDVTLRIATDSGARAASQPTVDSVASASVAEAAVVTAAPAPEPAGVVALESELLLMREASEANRQETRELRDRVGALEAQLSDIRRLLELRNERLSELAESGLPAASGSGQSGSPSGSATVVNAEPGVDGAPAPPSAPASADADAASVEATPDANAGLASDAEIGGAAQPAALADEGGDPKPLSGSTVAQAEMTERAEVQKLRTSVETSAEGRASRALEGDTSEPKRVGGDGVETEVVSEDGVAGAEGPRAGEDPAESERVLAEGEEAAAAPTTASDGEGPLAMLSTLREALPPWALPLLGVLFLLLLFWLKLRRRSVAQAPDEAPSPSQASGAEAAADAGAAIAGGVQPGEDDREGAAAGAAGLGMLSSGLAAAPHEETAASGDDLSHLMPGGPVDEAVMQALADADVYLTYGRYRDAERVLTDLDDTQACSASRFKLADVYLAMNDQAALARLTEAMQAAGDAEREPGRWAKIQAARAVSDPDLHAGPAPDEAPLTLDPDALSGFAATAVVPAAAPEPESEPESELAPESGLVTGAATEPGEGAEPEQVPKPELEREPEPELKPDPEPGPVLAPAQPPSAASAAISPEEWQGQGGRPTPAQTRDSDEADRDPRQDAPMPDEPPLRLDVAAPPSNAEHPARAQPIELQMVDEAASAAAAETKLALEPSPVLRDGTDSLRASPAEQAGLGGLADLGLSLDLDASPSAPAEADDAQAVSDARVGPSESQGDDRGASLPGLDEVADAETPAPPGEADDEPLAAAGLADQKAAEGATEADDLFLDLDALGLVTGEPDTEAAAPRNALLEPERLELGSAPESAPAAETQDHDAQRGLARRDGSEDETLGPQGAKGDGLSELELDLAALDAMATSPGADRESGKRPSEALPVGPNALGASDASADADADLPELELMPNDEPTDASRDAPGLEVPSGAEQSASAWPLESEGWDEFALKLDLARAYIDMEDPDAAAEILKDALKTAASGEQREEAEALLARLASRGGAS